MRKNKGEKKKPKYSVRLKRPKNLDAVLCGCENIPFLDNKFLWLSRKNEPLIFLEKVIVSAPIPRVLLICNAAKILIWFDFVAESKWGAQATESDTTGPSARAHRGSFTTAQAKAVSCSGRGRWFPLTPVSTITASPFLKPYLHMTPSRSSANRRLSSWRPRLSCFWVGWFVVSSWGLRSLVMAELFGLDSDGGLVVLIFAMLPGIGW